MNWTSLLIGVVAGYVIAVALEDSENSTVKKIHDAVDSVVNDHSDQTEAGSGSGT